MKERLPAVLQKIYQEKQKESQNFFWIGGVTDQRKLYHKDIICIRKVKGQKYVEFVMVNGAYKERLALHQIFEDLKSPAFIFAAESPYKHLLFAFSSILSFYISPVFHDLCLHILNSLCPCLNLNPVSPLKK